MLFYDLTKLNWNDSRSERDPVTSDPWIACAPPVVTLKAAVLELASLYSPVDSAGPKPGEIV